MTKLILKDEDLTYDQITYDCEVFTKDHRLLTWFNKVFDTEFKKVYSTKKSQCERQQTRHIFQ